MIVQQLTSLSRFFPPLTIVRAGSAERYLRKLGEPVEPGRYLTMAIVLGVIMAGATGAPLLLAAGIPWPALVILWAGLTLLVLQLPRMEFRTRQAQIERELPFWLRDLGMWIEMGMPFEKALEQSSRRPGAWSGQVRIVLAQIRQGMAFQKAMLQRAQEMESAPLKRAIAQILSVYAEGTAGREIRRLGEELLNARLHRLRDYAGQSALIGLVFIVVSAILPTFFLVMVGLSGSGWDLGWDARWVVPVMLGVFPLLMVLVLLIARALAPDPASTAGQRTYAPFLVALPLLLAASQLSGLMLYGILAATLAIIGVLLYPQYRKERRLEEVEMQLPDALLSVSGLPPSTSLERVLDTISAGEYGALSQEARISLRQLHARLKPSLVMEDYLKRNPGMFIERAMALLEQALASNRLERLSEVAEDMFRWLDIQRQRQGLLSVQKYTLLAGAVLLPLILKTATGSLGILSGGSGPALAAVASVLPPYLIVYALVTAYYVADIEGKPSQALLYFGGMSIAGILLLQ